MSELFGTCSTYKLTTEGPNLFSDQARCAIRVALARLLSQVTFWVIDREEPRRCRINSNSVVDDS